MRFLFFFFLCALSMALALPSVSFAQKGGMSLLRDEETERALKAMAKPIFVQAGLTPGTVRFILVNDNDLNAFVAGGQNIFIHTGLILATETPEELIGVIAHEAGHISAGHLFRVRSELSNMSVQAILAQLAGLAVAIGTRSPEAGIAISNAGGSLALRGLLRHTRTQEGSADQAGVRFLQDAGLPVTGFLSFMEKLSAQELLPESQQTQYLLTHPLTQDRIEFLQHVVGEKTAGKVPAAWSESHARMKAKLTGYLFPDRALRDKGTSNATRYGHAMAWWRKGQIEKSLSLLETLIQEEPDNPFFLELKGQILFESGRIEESLVPYKKAIALLPSATLIRIAYAYALIESKPLQKDRLELAVKELNVALSRERNNASAHRILAIAYGKLEEEGLSRLHLAEEAFLENKRDFAQREATIALQKLKKGTPAHQRAQDILDALERGKEKTEKTEKTD